MTKEHKIRVAVSQLKGQQRQDMILYLLKNPKLLGPRVTATILMLQRIK